MAGIPFQTFVLWWTALAVLVFVALFFVAAPYGRHAWLTRPAVPGRIGWLLMETPSAVLMAVWFLQGTHQQDAAAWCFLALWELHYLQRAFVYPLRMRGRVRPMPVPTALLAAGFNIVNARMISRWLFDLGPTRGVEWLADPRFIAGTALFVAGFVVNVRADSILLNLRRPGEAGYRIPFGGAFRWVSSPNYLGEIVEWFAFALATWSLPALAFAIWTLANLLPRALTNHRWYRQQFAEYPPERRAIVPYLL